MSGTRLVGRPGAEMLRGGGGNDTLIGRGGADELFGAGGDDLFVLSTVAELTVATQLDGGAGRDTVLLRDATTLSDAAFRAVRNV